MILASVSISLTLGSNGIFNKAISARDQMKIASYKEKIELIKLNLRIDKKDIEPLLLSEIQTSLDKEKWVNKTEIIEDEGIEKIKLETKEGFIFYITDKETEYKGKGQVVDTTALKRKDVIDLEILTEEIVGKKKVKITNLTENYYEIEYQIGSTEGEWTKIKSGKTVEVPVGQIIYARLVYGTNKGEIVELGVGYNNAKVTIVEGASISNITRKENKAFSDLFEVTWGEDGVGEIEYKITGTLTYGTDYTRIITGEEETIRYVSDLELGTYKIECKPIGPKSGVGNTEEIENIIIANLATTSVTDKNNNAQTAYGIYSEYDLVYFRDIINDNTATIKNAKVMNNIDLTNVCSYSEGSWEPIGNSTNKYIGTFDGNNSIISNIYIKDSNIANQGLFGYINNANIKNITVKDGDIEAGYNVGAIVGNSNESIITGCINDKTSVNSKNNISKEYTFTGNPWTGTYSNAGGIIGYSYNCDIISCQNSGNIQGINSCIGGIVGFDDGNRTRIISQCSNLASFSNTLELSTGCWGIGGIVGCAYNLVNIEYCNNSGSIISNVMDTGGIVGALANSTITNCNNLQNADIKGSTRVGGISGEIEIINSTSKSTITSCENSGKVTSTEIDTTTIYYHGQNDSNIKCSYAGGITGLNNGGDIEYCKNRGTIEKEGNYNAEIGGIVGVSINNSNIKYCANFASFGYSNSTEVGGIVGGTSQCTIEECYNTGAITGYDTIGGISGWGTYTTFKNCYNMGDISGTTHVGGISGGLWSYKLSTSYEYLYNCYNLGQVTGTAGTKDPWLGHWEYVTWDYVYTTETLNTAIGEGETEGNCPGTYYGAFSGTDEQIKSQLFTEIQKGYGSGKWAQSSDKNNGYPYLVNNVP